MPTTEKDFDALEKALEISAIQEVEKLLQNFDVTETNSKGSTCLMQVCRYSSSPKIAKLVFDKIVEAGGTALLKSQINATNRKGWTCLMLCVYNSSSPVVVNLVFEKIVEVGDTALLKSQLTAATDDGWTCLMLACRYSSSPEVVKLVFDKILEDGDTALLKSQLTATNNGGSTCLMAACSNSSSPEVMKLVFEKIVEVGDTALLKSQLTATSDGGWTCLMLACRYFSSPEVAKLLAAVLFELGLFEQQYATLNGYDKKKLKDNAGIESSSWTPDATSLEEVKTLLHEGSFVYAVHSNEHSRIKEILKNDLEAKKILDSTQDSMMQACFQSETKHQTVELLFSEIKRIGGDGYLKKLLSKENDYDAGETCLLSVCLRDSTKLKLVMETIEEVGGEAFLIEQIAKKRQSDGMSPLYALCRFASRYEVLALLISKFFESEFLGRRYLKEEFNSNPCLECLFGRPFDSQDEEGREFLFFVVNLLSITGLFEAEYSRLDKEKKKSLRNVCKIESGDWSRDWSTGLDAIGEIKKSINDKKK